MPNSLNDQTQTRLQKEMRDLAASVLMDHGKLIIDPKTKASKLLIFVPRELDRAAYSLAARHIYDTVGVDKEFPFTPLTYNHAPARIGSTSLAERRPRTPGSREPKRAEAVPEMCLQLDLTPEQTEKFEDAFKQYLRGPSAREYVPLDEQKAVARLAVKFIIAQATVRDN